MTKFRQRRELLVEFAEIIWDSNTTVKGCSTNLADGYAEF